MQSVPSEHLLLGPTVSSSDAWRAGSPIRAEIGIWLPKHTPATTGDVLPIWCLKKKRKYFPHVNEALLMHCTPKQLYGRKDGREGTKALEASLTPPPCYCEASNTGAKKWYSFILLNQVWTLRNHRNRHWHQMKPSRNTSRPEFLGGIHHPKFHVIRGWEQDAQKKTC